MKRIFAIAMLLCTGVPGTQAATLLVEAESFSQRGGWVVDQQSMDVMGSPYLLAHGMGVPVADATTELTVPEAGTYRVFVRTKDWVARWGASGSPGKFQVVIDGKPLAETFGTKGKEWSWHDGGTVELKAGKATVALDDLTGFEGRCDAILLTTDAGLTPPEEVKELASLRRKLLGLPWKPDDRGEFDLVVVGGGVPGCTAAVSAARLGLKVALVQDRPVLGGNSSSEVRVWINGGFCLPPYPAIGEVVREMYTRPAECPGPAEAYGDDLKHKVVTAEENVTLMLWEHVDRVEMDGERIRAVASTNVITGRTSRIAGRWFVDCTGDGTVGFLAGADYEMTDEGHLGTTNLWAVEDAGKKCEFPRCPWALDLTDKPFPTEIEKLGRWYWESGFDIDTIREAEAIRDHNFRAMYGAWDCVKNAKGLYPTHRLVWSAYVAGKRESRRMLGDVVLTAKDVTSGREFPDACVASTWSIDLHYPNAAYVSASPENPFLSVARFTRFKTPYLVPYRCLYSRNVPNLMMAGRNISVTHEALGTIRVMATGGLMGEVLGRAVAICKERDCDPRQVVADYLDEFKQSLLKPTKVFQLKPPKFAKEVGRNIAPEATVSSSGDRDPAESPVTLVNDGQADVMQNSQRWLSTAAVPNWVELKWREPRTIAAARVVSGYDVGGRAGDPTSDFVLQAFDGQEWKGIAGTATRENAEVDWQRTFEPVSASRMRLYVTGAKGDISRIWEIELYEPAESK